MQAELRVSVTTHPYSRLVDAFCRAARTAFAPEAERETRAGLRRCLALNGPAGDALHQCLGPSREHVALLRDAAGAIAAGMNFICFPMPGHGNLMTVHTTYVFVAAAWRGQGLLRRVYDAIETIARAYAAESGLPDDAAMIFIGEQKDPFRMAAGADAFDRLAIWGSLGARVVVFPYVQPSLTEGGAPDCSFFLRILFRDAARPLEARVLAEHLRRFFSISVAKGRYDPLRLPAVAAQMRALRGRTVPTRRMPTPATLADWQRREVGSLQEGCSSLKKRSKKLP